MEFNLLKFKYRMQFFWELWEVNFHKSYVEPEAVNNNPKRPYQLIFYLQLLNANGKLLTTVK